MAILTVQQWAAGAKLPSTFALADTLSLLDSASNSAGGSPPTGTYLAENFDTYTSTANMLSDPRGIYSTTEDVNTAQMFLDKTVGYTTYGLTQSMRYDFPDRTGEGGSGTSGRCGDYTIGRNLQLAATQTEVWIELVHKSQSTFKTAAPSGWSCTSAAAYKTLFGRLDVSRYNLVLGIFGETSDYTFSQGPGNQEPSDDPMPWTPFDGNWHVYRMHFKIGTGANGICALMVDGSTLKNYTGLSKGGASNLYGIALGRNMNQGPGAAQSEWWGACNTWTVDPGWGI